MNSVIAPNMLIQKSSTLCSKRRLKNLKSCIGFLFWMTYQRFFAPDKEDPPIPHDIPTPCVRWEITEKHWGDILVGVGAEQCGEFGECEGALVTS